MITCKVCKKQYKHFHSNERKCKSCYFQDITRRADELNLKVLSSGYVRNADKYHFECLECGHKFKKMRSNFMRKTTLGCPNCKRPEQTSKKERAEHLKVLKQIAKEKGGRCLSKEYVKNTIKLEFNCGNGHPNFFKRPTCVKKGSWCPYCAGKGLKIDFFKNIAKERGGKCLDNHYPKKNYANLDFVCAFGHKFSLSAYSIKQGKWCRSCSKSIGENIVRYCMEQIFKKHFPSSMPRWLTNDKGNRMELDGYCEEIGIAFEHHGLQHYRRIDFYHDKKSFERRKKNDIIKRRVCKKNKVVLIEVPAVLRITEIKDVYPLIIKQLKEKGVKIPRHKKPNIEKSFTEARHDELFRELKTRVEKLGGKMISKNVFGKKYKFKVQCKCGNKFETDYHRVKNKTWCERCGYEKIKIPQKTLNKVLTDLKNGLIDGDIALKHDVSRRKVQELRETKLKGSFYRKCKIDGTIFKTKNGRATMSPKNRKRKCVCGKEFVVSYSERRLKYCSIACGAKGRTGKKSPKAKFNNRQVLAIRKSKMPVADLALKYKVSQTTIYNIKKRKIYRHVKGEK